MKTSFPTSWIGGLCLLLLSSCAKPDHPFPPELSPYLIPGGDGSKYVFRDTVTQFVDSAEIELDRTIWDLNPDDPETNEVLYSTYRFTQLGEANIRVSTYADSMGAECRFLASSAIRKFYRLSDGTYGPDCCVEFRDAIYADGRWFHDVLVLDLPDYFIPSRWYFARDIGLVMFDYRSRAVTYMQTFVLQEWTLEKVERAKPY